MIQRSIINSIFLRELTLLPESICKVEIGICNQVYWVTGQGRSFILRMNDVENYMLGTCRFLPIFNSIDIKVPEIVAECYSLDSCGYYYQIQTIIDGKDLDIIMEDLTIKQIEDLANEIGIVINKFSSLYCENYFGAWTGIMEERFDSQTEVLLAQLNKIGERLPEWLSELYESLVNTNHTYFDNVIPNLYFDDMASKNVMIANGKFNGLVDLDFMRRGDILDLLGRILGCWEYSNKGRFFTNSLIDKLQLTHQQSKYMSIYAILNLINWISEEDDARLLSDYNNSNEMLKSVERIYEGLNKYYSY